MHDPVRQKGNCRTYLAYFGQSLNGRSGGSLALVLYTILTISSGVGTAESRNQFAHSFRDHDVSYNLDSPQQSYRSYDSEFEEDLTQLFPAKSV